jgi:limonene 1,2-monooxygenase
MSKMRFGAFLPPVHPQVGEDPTSGYERDLDVLRYMDSLGFEEAWIGEHHSSGAEAIPDPALFIAHAANHTRYIKLGTGVISLPYHNPLWVADRMLFLDHLTRGRMMLGVGSGAFPTDSGMIGLTPSDMRGAFEEDVDVLMHLLTSDEPISVKTARYSLVEARSQLQPFSDPLFDTAVTSVVTPTGARLAGKHGMGVLSVAASSPEGFEALADNWRALEERAEQFGQNADRSKWRIVVLMHIAPTKKQAMDDVQFGLRQFQNYFQDVLGGSSLIKTDARNPEELAEQLNAANLGVIGTPDEAVAFVERLQEQSGGFGCLLMMHHEWALPDATRRHYELLARFVKPRFQGTTRRLEANMEWTQSMMGGLKPKLIEAIAEANERHARERAEARDTSKG